MKFPWLTRLATAACVVAAIYLVSILVTGGYAVNLGGIGRFDADKLWPAIVATLGFALLRGIFREGSIADAFKRSPAFFIFALALIVFLANGKTISGGDSVPAKTLPLRILTNGDFYLDELVTPTDKRIPYYLVESRGHYVSDYPVGAAIMALPLYVPSIVSGVSPKSRVYGELEKVSAATIVALSAMLLYLAAARMTANWMAVLIAALYALGTSSLSVSSQALWQHGPATLALTAAIYCIVRAREDARWAGYVGLPLAMEVITRPADVLIAGPLALYAVVTYPGAIPTMLATGLPVVVFQFWYNAVYFGNPLRIQFVSTQAAGGQSDTRGVLSTPFLSGLALVLLSPGRGLFFYSPIFLFSAAGLAFTWRANGNVLLRYLGVGALFSIILVAKWRTGSGGESFGPRLLADIAPIMALGLFPLANSIRQRRDLAIALAVLAAWSITANMMGAFVSYREWDRWALSEPQTRLWLWADNPVIDPMRAVFDAARIATGGLPTSRNSPNLLDGKLITLTLPPASAAPGTRVRIGLSATNTGKAVWLSRRSPDDAGAVSLGCEWKLDGKTAGENEPRRGLHLDVFPGESMEMQAAALTPDMPGRYELDISLAAAATSGPPLLIGQALRIPVTVAAP